MDQLDRKLWWYFKVSLSLFFSFWSHSLLKENDIFFHLRIGEEIYRSHQVIFNDFWSHTGNGRQWYNHEWLSHLLLWVWSNLSADHYALLPTLRALLVFFLNLQILNTVSTVCKKEHSKYFVGLVLLPLFYATNWLQMRPELFVFSLFSSLILIWIRPGNPKALIVKSTFLFLLWSNLHNGTVLFGITFGILALLLDKRTAPLSWHIKIISTLGFILTWFSTPIGVHCIDKLFSNAFTFSTMINPDMMGFYPRLLDPRFAGFSFWISIFLAGTATIGFQSKNLRTFQKPGPYDSRLFFYFILILFTLLSVWKIRSRIYLILFIIPVLVPILERVWYWIAIQPQKIRLFLLTPLAGLLATITIVHIQLYLLPLGFGLSEKSFPVYSAKFVSAVKPRPKLLNNMNFGCYLTEELREYRISEATSGETFDHDYIPKRHHAMSDPSLFSKLLEEYGINLVIESFPEYYLSANSILNSHSEFFPRKNWALVFFDNASVVYLKRTSENEEIIKKYEYKYLLNELPPEIAIRTSSLSGQFKKEFEAELDLCLQRFPSSDYCQAGKAAFASGRSNE